MKKNYICYLAAGALFLSACSKDSVDLTGDGVPAEGSTPEVVLFGVHPTTKTTSGSRVAISGDQAVWSEQDSIGVFNATSTAPAKFTLTAGAGSAEGSFAGKIGYEAGDRLFVLAPYVPDTIAIVPTAAKIGFNGQMQDGFGANAEAHLGRYAYMASKPVTLTEGKAQLQFSYLAVKMSFEFSLPEAATVRFLTMTAERDILYDKGVVDLTAASPAAKGWGTASRCLSLGFTNGAVAAGQIVTAHMMMLPIDLSAKKVTFYVSAEKADGTPVTYTMTKSKGLNFEVASSYTAEVNGLSAVDTHIPMVYVPGGSLNICALDVEGKTDQQALDTDYKVNSFWIAQTEVTNQQYCDFLNSRKPLDTQLNAWLVSSGYAIDEEALQIERKGGSWAPKNGPILNADGKTTHDGSYGPYPMVNVTYLGANAYCAWLAEKMCGYSESNYTLGCYLPTEAQWEYAATGSEWNPDWFDQLWAGSDMYDDVMWSNLNCDSEGSACMGMYVGNGDNPNTISPSGSHNGGTHPVATLKANYLNIYDLSGNAGEICRDWFNYGSFPYGPVALDPWCSDINAAETASGEQLRACRGGFWSSTVINGLTFARDYFPPGMSYYTLGFRPILPLK